MPYTIVISKDEVEAAKSVNAKNLTGSVLDVTPDEMRRIMASLLGKAVPGAQRLIDRLSTLYGQHAAKVRKSAVANEHISDPAQIELPFGAPVAKEAVEDEPIAEEQAIKPVRKRKA